MANSLFLYLLLVIGVSVAREGENCYIDGVYTWCNGHCCDGEEGCCGESKTSMREQPQKKKLEPSRAREPSLEKTNNGLTAEDNQVTTGPENTQTIVQNLTERISQLEKDNAKLTETVAALKVENAALKESKAVLEAEVYRERVKNVELTEKNDNLERENKQLSDQLREVKQALEDANRKIQELTATNAVLTTERDTMAASLRDTDDALKDAENNLANANAALAALRSEMEQRLREKDVDIEAVRCKTDPTK